MKGGASHPEVEFALVLARTIQFVKDDPEQLRAAIYQLARHKLQEQVGDDESAESRRLMDALEVAIEGVEEHSADGERAALGAPLSKHLPPPRETPVQHESRGEIVRRLTHADAAVGPRKPYDSDVVDQFPSRTPGPDRNSRADGARRAFAAPVRLGLIVALLVAGAAAVRFGPQAWSLRTVADGAAAPRKPAETITREPVAERPPAVAAPAAEAPAAGPPLPTAYGVYALHGDRLYELEALQGRVPDIRVAVSSAINKPSVTTIPDGSIKFIVYRRETGNSDQAEVRIVARMTQAITFDSTGKPVSSKTDENWVIRNIAIPYRTVPIKDRPEMYEIQSRDPDAPLSPGRYGLVVKGQAYDFTVAGRITDKRQCLERLAAANGTFLSECQLQQ